MSSFKAIVFAFFVIPFCLKGQIYSTPQFEELIITTTNYYTIDNSKHGIDIYEPKGSSLTKRPTMIFVHGGGFMSGARDHKEVVNYCKHWARCGYTVASISYRLTLKGKSFHCSLPAGQKIATFQHAVNDLRNATAHLLSKHTTYHIDPQKVFLSGSSAGAETVLHAAFWNNDDMNLKEQALADDFHYAAVLSYAGAIIDTSLIREENLIPAGLFHGTCDGLVPYGTAAHHYCPETTPGALQLSGSQDIHTRIVNLEGSSLLITACNGGHEICNTAMKTHINEAVAFIHETVYQEKKLVISQTYQTNKSCNLRSVDNNCSN